MDPRIVEGIRERSRRPVRNKKYNRRIYGEEKRIPKRLFTPEIKRFLKDWLVRRRDNPYPNRDEKKVLASQTGLTYIQVCNWFANWRRKLKNAGKEPQRKTWGHLIKTYNNQVQGNVEHFSICSEDSIWEEEIDFQNHESPHSPADKTVSITNGMQHLQCRLNAPDHNYATQGAKLTNNNSEGFVYAENDEYNPFSQHANKYKNHIMEKYLRDCQKPEVVEDLAKPSMISKWLESAVNFRPSENNYVNWTVHKKKAARKERNGGQFCLQHGREELDAAEALTKLANAHTKS